MTLAPRPRCPAPLLTAVATVALALGACASDGGPGVVASDASGGATLVHPDVGPLPDGVTLPNEPAAVDPPSGVWVYLDGGIQQNTCGEGELFRDADTLFQLTSHGDGTFTVHQGDGDADFLCVVAGDTFACPERLKGSYDFNPDGYDAVVSWVVSVTGTFSSPSALAGTQRFAVSCEGSACVLAPAALGAALPCAYTIAFTATAPLAGP